MEIKKHFSKAYNNKNPGIRALYQSFIPCSIARLDSCYDCRFEQFVKIPILRQDETYSEIYQTCHTLASFIELKCRQESATGILKMMSSVFRCSKHKHMDDALNREMSQSFQQRAKKVKKIKQGGLQSEKAILDNQKLIYQISKDERKSTIEYFIHSLKVMDSYKLQDFLIKQGYKYAKQGDELSSIETEFIISDISQRLNQFNRFQLPISRRKTHYVEQMNQYSLRGIKINFESISKNPSTYEEIITVANIFTQNNIYDEFIHIQQYLQSIKTMSSQQLYKTKTKLLLKIFLKCKEFCYNLPSKWKYVSFEWSDIFICPKNSQICIKSNYILKQIHNLTNVSYQDDSFIIQQSQEYKFITGMHYSFGSRRLHKKYINRYHFYQYLLFSCRMEDIFCRVLLNKKYEQLKGQQSSKFHMRYLRWVEQMQMKHDPFKYSKNMYEQLILTNLIHLRNDNNRYQLLLQHLLPLQLLQNNQGNKNIRQKGQFAKPYLKVIFSSQIKEMIQHLIKLSFSIVQKRILQSLVKMLQPLEIEAIFSKIKDNHICEGFSSLIRMIVQQSDLKEQLIEKIKRIDLFIIKQVIVRVISGCPYNQQLALFYDFSFIAPVDSTQNIRNSDSSSARSINNYLGELNTQIRANQNSDITVIKRFSYLQLLINYSKQNEDEIREKYNSIELQASQASITPKGILQIIEQYLRYENQRD